MDRVRRGGDLHRIPQRVHRTSPPHHDPHTVGGVGPHHAAVRADLHRERTTGEGQSLDPSGGLGQGRQYPLELGAAAIMTIPVAVLFFVLQRRTMDTTTGAVTEEDGRLRTGAPVARLDPPAGRAAGAS